MWSGIKKKETDLIGQERAFALKKEGVMRQEKITIERSEQLSKQMEKFLEDKTQTEKDIDERKTALFLQDRTLETKKKTLERTEKALKDWDKKLHDERETLGRAWAELERKKISP